MLPGGGELAGELPFFELGLERRSLFPRQSIPPAEGVGHSLIPSNHPDRRREADGEEHRDESHIDNMHRFSRANWVERLPNKSSMIAIKGLVNLTRISG